MKLTVVIPTRNRPQELEQCLDGWARQTVGGADVLVVDDGSTPPAAVPAPFRCLRQPPSGLSAARNAALETIPDGLLILYDDDLRPHPDTIAFSLDFHRRHPHPGEAAVLPFVLDARLAGDRLSQWAFSRHYPFPQKTGWYPPKLFWGGCVTCKRELFGDLRFDPAWDFAEDTDLARRLPQPLRIYCDVSASPAGTMTRAITLEQVRDRARRQGAAARRLGWPAPATAPLPLAEAQALAALAARGTAPIQKGAWRRLHLHWLAQGWERCTH